MTKPTRTLIMGATGRDFHDFLTVFKDNPDYRVKAFTMVKGQNLEGTINSSKAEGVVLGTPSDLSKILEIDKKIFRAVYRIEEKGKTFREILEKEMK